MNTKGIRRLAVAAVVAMTPALVTSFHANAAPSSGGTGPDVNAQPVSKLKKGGTFVWAINTLPDNFNTSHVDGNTADTSYIMGATLPGYFTVDGKGALVVDKNYASKVVLTKKSPQTVTYTLNPKAKWSDGKTVGLADFVGMWKANNGSDPAYEVVSTTGYEDIASVKKGKTANDVVVTFKNVYADWQGLFGGLLPASVTATAEAFNKSWLTKPTVTAGPFKYDSTDQTASTVTLVPNSKWWGAKPVLSKIVYRAIDPATQLDALANGEVNYIDIGPDANAFKRAKGLSSLRVHVAKAPNYRHMTFGSKTAISRNKTIRQAIMMSIDRNTVARAMIGVIDPGVTSLDNHVFVKGISCYQNNAGIYGTQNYQKVDAMLDAAGWTGNPRKNAAGDTLEITITIPSGVPTSAQEAQLFQAMLSAAGIKLNIETVDRLKFFSDYITPGNFEMTVFSWIGGVFPISGATGILTTTGEQNYGKIGTSAIDALFTKANKELNPVKRCKLANDADKLVWAEGHSMINYQRPNVTATSKNVANMGSWGFTSLDYTKIGFTK